MRCHCELCEAGVVRSRASSESTLVPPSSSPNKCIHRNTLGQQELRVYVSVHGQTYMMQATAVNLWGDMAGRPLGTTRTTRCCRQASTQDGGSGAMGSCHTADSVSAGFRPVPRPRSLSPRSERLGRDAIRGATPLGFGERACVFSEGIVVFPCHNHGLRESRS